MQESQDITKTAPLPLVSLTPLSPLAGVVHTHADAPLGVAELVGKKRLERPAHDGLEALPADLGLGSGVGLGSGSGLGGPC